MKKIDDKDLEYALKNQKRAPGMVDNDSFWDEFKERAEQTEQDSKKNSPILFIPRWGQVAASLVLTSGIILLIMLFTTNGVIRDVINVAVIDDYEIYEDHSAVLILEDDVEPGTILWITGLNNNDKIGG